MRYMRRAFTLIELLVVIAIIAILAAILFPVFSQAKEAAKQTKALAQMKQLATSLMIYAGDADDNFVPASARSAVAGVDPIVWTEGLAPYVKNAEIFIAPAAPDSRMATNWATRRNQSIGYSDATGVDPLSTAIPGAALPGTEGFTSAANFGQAENSAQTGLIVTTPNSTGGKERGYVFNPYNGATPTTGTAAENYMNGLPLISDVNLCTTRGVIPAGAPAPCAALGNSVFNCSGNTPGALKPIFARYRADGKGNGTTPVIFADGHAKVYSANSLNSFGKVIWRFR
jgi:prepilin-type N-terminal cleavage/methylation domain-containing protein